MTQHHSETKPIYVDHALTKEGRQVRHEIRSLLKGCFDYACAQQIDPRELANLIAVEAGIIAGERTQ